MVCHAKLVFVWLHFHPPGRPPPTSCVLRFWLYILLNIALATKWVACLMTWVSLARFCFVPGLFVVTIGSSRFHPGSTKACNKVLKSDPFPSSSRPTSLLNPPLNLVQSNYLVQSLTSHHLILFYLVVLCCGCLFCCEIHCYYSKRARDIQFLKWLAHIIVQSGTS